MVSSLLLFLCNEEFLSTYYIVFYVYWFQNWDELSNSYDINMKWYIYFIYIQELWSKSLTKAGTQILKKKENKFKKNMAFFKRPVLAV